MIVISRIRDYIVSLDNKQYRIFVLIFLSVTVFVASYLIYRKYNIYKELQVVLNDVNKQRKRTQNILQQSKDLKKQREEVDLLLSEDKNFRILDYFNRLTQELNLISASPAYVSSPKDLNMSYNEVELSCSFSNINTKQLVQLLEAIDKNRRVYTKELIVEKSQKSPMIDIKLIIATLEPIATA